MSKKGSSIKGITWQETSNGPLFEDSYLGVTLEILDHQPTGYAIHVNGEQDCEYFPSIDAAKDYANSLGTISLASAQVRIRQKLPDFGMHLRSIGFRDGDNAIIPEIYLAHLAWTSPINFQASGVFKMEGKLLKIDLYFCTHQNENLLDELSQLCDEPDPEVGELWFSRQIEYLHFSRPIRIFDVLAALASPEGRPVGPRYEPFEIVGFSTRSE